MARVAAVALDAAEWWLVERLAEEGVMPNLARMRAEGTTCRLQNVAAYRSELAWSQFLSGKRGEDLDYPTYLVFDPATYDSYAVGVEESRPFYALGPARKVIAFDLIHSTISPEVEGLQVTAWGAHSPQYPRASRPKGLLTEVDRAVGPHPAFDNDLDSGWYSPAYVSQLTRLLTEGVRRRPAALALLQDRLPDWDLLLTCMSEIHSAAHHCWHGVDESHPLHRLPVAANARASVLDVCRAVDAAVGDVAARLPDDAILAVFALHGAQPADDLISMLLLPELFHRRRFGTSLLRDPDQEDWRRRGCPPMVLGEREMWWDYVRARFDASPRDRALNLLRRRPALHEAARRLAGRPRAHRLGDLKPIPPESDPPEENAAERIPLDWSPARWYRPYWPSMRAFVLPTFTDTHVRINVRGRERDGVVDVEDYGRACEEVISFVREVRDARTGKAALSDVIPLRPDDPLSEGGPDADLLLVWEGAPDAIVHPDVGTIGPVPHARTGAHTSRGFALFSGAGIERRDLGTRSAFDLPPTILDLLGVTPAEDLAGQSLAGELRAAAAPGVV